MSRAKRLPTTYRWRCLITFFFLDPLALRYFALFPFSPDKNARAAKESAGWVQNIKCVFSSTFIILKMSANEGAPHNLHARAESYIPSTKYLYIQYAYPLYGHDVSCEPHPTRGWRSRSAQEITKVGLYVLCESDKSITRPELTTLSSKRHKLAKTVTECCINSK